MTASVKYFDVLKRGGQALISDGYEIPRHGMFKKEGGCQKAEFF